MLDRAIELFCGILISGGFCVGRRQVAGYGGAIVAGVCSDCPRTLSRGK